MTDKADTPLPFCITCNKVIKDISDAMFHATHNVGTKSFNQIYRDAIHDTGGNRPEKPIVNKKKKYGQIRGY